MLQTVSTRAEILENARTYEKELLLLNEHSEAKSSRIAQTYTRCQSWIAVKDGDTWRLVPTKFGGYAKMNLKIYHGDRQHVSAGAASRALESLGLSEAPNGHEAYRSLRKLGQKVGLATRSNSAVYVLDGEELPDAELASIDTLLDLMQRLNLSKSGRALLSERVLTAA